MIEIPESYSLSKQLNEELAGKKIVEEAFNTHPHKFCFMLDDVSRYHHLIHGKTIERVDAIGGNIEFIMEDVRMVLGEGLNIRVTDDEKNLAKKHQLLVKFEDGSWMTGTSQMYGAIYIFIDGEFDSKYYLWGKQKPSPLTEAFSYPYFQQMFEDTKKNMSLKGFLATEQRIPGLGNGVLQDILFRAGMHPKRKLSTLEEEDVKYLYDTVKKTLREMAEKGGRDTEKDIYGQPGGYRMILSKNTLREPCPNCGGFISKQAYLGGAVYYCSQCQEL